MDAQIKTKEVDISADDHPKLEKIGDYWSKDKIEERVNLVNEYQYFFARDYKYLKGLI